ncbi:MAG: FAD-binding protein [Bacteroidia bacterium]|nr:FAD-binding protein [Bacteroidia bacterium]
MHKNLKKLKRRLAGDFLEDKLTRVLYATDASVYREVPLGVAFPKNTEDLQKLVQFASDHQIALIPRAAGTSLAGQCVGDGIVVDVSKYMTKIIEFNPDEHWVRVQPGVVRDELNHFLNPHGLFFSPITSTANRAMIGGMVGNNSCGTNSIVYGSTRDHVMELETVLSDGSRVTFKALDELTFYSKAKLNNLEGKIYKQALKELSRPEIQKAIREEFPKPQIHRRNTGYALDYLLDSALFSDSSKPFNFCKLLCGSEGTLAFISEIKLHLDALPKTYDVVVAAHFTSVHDSMKATQFAMEHQPTACELMDKIILDCTKENIEQRKHRAFVEGDPEAILLVEFRGDDIEEALVRAKKLVADFKSKGIGYAFPIVQPPDTKGVWSLRSAGLGLLANIPGDKKAVACIEDTAVALEDLADYIDDFDIMMEEFGQRSVHYAHAGAGEIHLRPILDLKDSKDRQAFYDIGKGSATLVKKYRGSLSGEHGDGRVRAPFIKMMVGQKNYDLFQKIKKTWDPFDIFNPGKIVNAGPMNESLRYEADQVTRSFDTVYSFENEGGILRAAEKCNGSGDCRKLPLSGGTMCPSFQATRNEKDSTRARANVLREFLTRSDRDNPFDQEEIKEVMDLCLSCKGCTSECPSNVDMASLKAEFLHQYYKSNEIPFRSKIFAGIADWNRMGSKIPAIYNFLLSNKLTSTLAKRYLEIAKLRSIPTVQGNLFNWYKKNYKRIRPADPIQSVYMFCDEFTRYNDTSIGKKAIQLLAKLGYDVKMIEHPESGRAALSKGLLTMAKKRANDNVALFHPLIGRDTPLIGIEPSAILSFRDEYPRIVSDSFIQKAQDLAQNAYMIDEFLASEIQMGQVRTDVFTNAKKHIKFHGHCHQKALSDPNDSVWLLSLPKNYDVEVIPSGCCGMAGSFGYEAEHYEVSQQVGELVLFPAIRESQQDTIITATGTSCRHQIFDGTGRKAMHPVEVLWEALI